MDVLNIIYKIISTARGYTIYISHNLNILKLYIFALSAESRPWVNQGLEEQNPCHRTQDASKHHQTFANNNEPSGLVLQRASAD